MPTFLFFMNWYLLVYRAHHAPLLNSNYMGIYLSRGDITVAHHFLYIANICSRPQQVGGKAMAKGMTARFF